MRRLLIVLAFLMVCSSANAVGQPNPPPTGGGSSDGQAPDGQGTCTAAPAACQGAPLPVPGQAAPGTVGAVAGQQAGCIGRILTTEGSNASASQQQSDSVPYCQVDSDGDGVTDSVPPPPPTHPEIVALLCADATIPAARIGHNPRDYGITGFHTWLWDATQPAPATTSGTIRGYAVSCTLTPTTWTFDIGDPHAERYGHDRTHTASEPGSEDESTPVQHFWEVKGTYTLTLDVTWQRTTTAGADEPTRSATIDHQVKEVRAGMTTPDQ